MGRAPCCAKVGLHRGPWTAREDALLTDYIQTHGEGNWRSLPKEAGLLRCGKSCRLRWMNYLRPDIKRGNISPDEDDLIIRLHALLGNKWSLIAGRLPGRTDNEIKNYWNSHLSKRLKNQDHGKGLATSNRKKRSTNRKNNTKKPHNKQNGETGQITLETRTKIHLPKPTRLTSLLHERNISNVAATTSNNSSDMGNQGYPSSKLKDDEATIDDLIFSLPVLENGDVFIEEDDSCNALAIDFSAEDNMLEKIYEEYSQLLNSEEGQFHLNSVAESLVV